MPILSELKTVKFTKKFFFGLAIKNGSRLSVCVCGERFLLKVDGFSAKMEAYIGCNSIPSGTI